MKALVLTIIAAFAVAGGLFTINSGKNVKLSGKQVTREIKVENFTGINSSAGIDVHFTSDRLTPVKVETDETLMPFIDIYVRDAVLHMGYTENIYTKDQQRKTIVYVSAPKVNNFMASSSSDIHIHGKINAPKISMAASSNADITGEVSCTGINIAASSSGEVKLSGSATKVAIKASSSAKVKLSEFKCQVTQVSASSSADVKLSGSAGKATINASSSAEVDMEKTECLDATVVASSNAEVDITVSNSLKASASSGAEISYYGSPKTKSINKSSGGKVKAKI